MPKRAAHQLRHRARGYRPQTYTVAVDAVGDISVLARRATRQLAPVANDWDLTALAERQSSAMFEKLRAVQRSASVRKAALTVLREVLPQDGIMTCDVGAHTHLIGQLWRDARTGSPDHDQWLVDHGLRHSRRHRGEAGPSGKHVCTVVGDGGFLMTAGELATALRCNAKIVVVLLTDNDLALIRIKQEKKHNPIYGTPVRDERARSAATHIFGVPVRTAHDPVEFRKALEWAFASDSSAIVEAVIDSREYDGVVLKKDKP